MPPDDNPPFIALVERVDRALVAGLARAAAAGGFPQIRAAHNAVFATLGAEGSRVSDMAAGAGITKQSMAALVHDLEGLGIVEVGPDPTDGRAKLVSYTPRGWEVVRGGQSHLREVEEQIERLLGARELARVRAAMTRVASHYERQVPDQPE